MRITPGPNNPNHAHMMPTTTFTPARRAATAPRYALRLNNGPGMACAMAKPAKNCSSVTQDVSDSLLTQLVAPLAIEHVVSYCTTSFNNSGSTT